MKLVLSRIIATFLSIWYSGCIRYKYINSNGFWEFEIYVRFNYLDETILYQTKGLRKC